MQPDARERFMEAKEAYQQLLDEREGRARPGSNGSGAGRSAGYGAGRSGSASAGSSAWGYRGSTSGGASSYGRGQQQQRWQPAEEAYSFGTLMGMVAGLATRFGGPAAVPLVVCRFLRCWHTAGGCRARRVRPLARCSACAASAGRPTRPPRLHAAAAIHMPMFFLLLLLQATC